jgi:hypothetical protein
VDVTVQRLFRRAMRQALQTSGAARIPFIWFWPDGRESCALMTHDVEGPSGRGFCPELMDLDDSFGIKAAFQVVPESVSGPSDPLIVALRSRGFEVNVHDLNHDGSLFQERHEFLRRAQEINRHARALGSHGFRSGAMYREQSWYDALDVAYDMSVPNVAHLEPQRGGCCTVMPYFVGNILELPLTTTQDYSLFHVLGDYTIELWQQQIEAIAAENGLISFIVHPDYVKEARARRTYVRLLGELAALRDSRRTWIALPADVNSWWRNRDRMKLVRHGGKWVIEGEDAARARVAFASLDGDRVVYERPPSVAGPVDVA